MGYNIINQYKKKVSKCLFVSRCRGGEWWPSGVPTCINSGCLELPTVTHSTLEELDTLAGVGHLDYPGPHPLSVGGWLWVDLAEWNIGVAP